MWFMELSNATTEYQYAYYQILASHWLVTVKVICKYV